tara:strand:+ start:523 stop:783 length:261 start_codon:yes stop_codon:yes gene_type:complete
MIDKIKEMYNEATVDNLLIADGFDDCIIGVNNEYTKVIYSYSKCVDVLMNRDKMTKEDAIEWMEFNVVSAYMGDNTPIWCKDEEYL